MAWITSISEADAQGALKVLYDRLANSPGRTGHVANIMKALSLKPQVLSMVSGVFRAATFGASSLTRVQEEMIATLVSSLNHCHY
jgi:alkylhydroperoxidase family enzyme